MAFLLVVASLPIVGGAGGASALSFKGGCAVGPAAKFGPGPITVVDQECTFKVPGTGNLVDRAPPVYFLMYGSGTAANVKLKASAANGEIFVTVGRPVGSDGYRILAQCHKNFKGTVVCLKVEQSSPPAVEGETLLCMLSVGSYGNFAATAGGGCLF